MTKEDDFVASEISQFAQKSGFWGEATKKCYVKTPFKSYLSFKILIKYQN